MSPLYEIQWADGTKERLSHYRKTLEKVYKSVPDPSRVIRHYNARTQQVCFSHRKADGSRGKRIASMVAVPPEQQIREEIEKWIANYEERLEDPTVEPPLSNSDKDVMYVEIGAWKCVVKFINDRTQ